jgi:hypothetical protein
MSTGRPAGHIRTLSTLEPLNDCSRMHGVPGGHTGDIAAGFSSATRRFRGEVAKERNHAMLLHQVVTVTQATPSGGLDAATRLIESWAKIAGIAVAGIWSYLVFVRQRQRYPRASLKQTVIARDLSVGRRLVTVSVKLSNIGQRLIEVDIVTVVIQQIAPLNSELTLHALRDHDPLNSAGSREIRWFKIGYRRTAFVRGNVEVEPGESEQLNFDFSLESTVDAIKVDVHVENVMKRRPVNDWLRSKKGTKWFSIQRPTRCLGWQCIEFYSFRESPETPRLIEAIHSPGGTDEE